MKRTTWRTIVWGALAALVVAAAWATRFGTRWPSIYFMTGASMEPSVAAREYFLAWAPPRALERGDLVIFRFRDEDGTFHVLRRVAGLPGDRVAMVEGAVVVGGARPSWPYRVVKRDARRSPMAIEGDLLTWGPWTVPPDSVLLLADTRDMIGWPDSRFIGFVAREDIIAIATRTVTGRPLR